MGPAQQQAWSLGGRPAASSYAPDSLIGDRERSEALSRCLRGVLQQALVTTEILSLQVWFSLLLDGAVVVERASAGRMSGECSVLSMSVKRLPKTMHVPDATLLVFSTNERGRAHAQTLPALLAAVMDGELSRLAAERSARRALEIANRDPSTGLGNRRAWLHALMVESGRAQRTGRPLAVIILDLDGLKMVNDAHGHAAGDALIIRAAEALSASRRATDSVCRLGGDEFGIAAPDLTSEQAEQLVALLRARLDASGVPISLGWSVGAAGTPMDDLWQRADAAMYADKRARR